MYQFVYSLESILIMNKRQRIPKNQSRMDNPETLATLGTQDKEKDNTIGVEYHYTQTNTNNVNKT